MRSFGNKINLPKLDYSTQLADATIHGTEDSLLRCKALAQMMIQLNWMSKVLFNFQMLNSDHTKSSKN